MENSSFNTVWTNPVFNATENLSECDFPFIHAHGSKIADLVYQYEVAAAALDDFSIAFNKIKLNYQDYSWLGDTSYLKAKNTQDEVFGLINEIHLYLQDHLAYLQKQL